MGISSRMVERKTKMPKLADTFIALSGEIGEFIRFSGRA